MKKLLLLGLVLLAGCGEKQISVPGPVEAQVGVPTSATTNRIVKEKDLTDQDKISLMQFEAKKRGLQWYVICVPKLAEEGSGLEYYLAVVEPLGVPRGATYYEDGARDWWPGRGQTPADALYDAYQVLNDPPPQHVDHRPQPAPPRAKNNCDYNRVLDSKHEGPLPCKDGQ